MCVTQQVRAPKVAKLREVRSLQLTICEAHRLPFKLVPNPYCMISLNQVKVARTKVKSGQDPVFDETFDLDDIPPDVLTFTVTVMNRGRRAKDAEVAEVLVDMTSLKSGSTESEEWYNLRGVTPIGEWGSIRYVHFSPKCQNVNGMHWGRFWDTLGTHRGRIGDTLGISSSYFFQIFQAETSLFT